MTAPQRSLCAALALCFALRLALTLSACSVDPDANPAFGCKGCAGSCVMGFCLQAEDGDAGLSDGGGAAGTGGTGAAGDDAGPPPPPEACSEPGKGEFCYEGPADTATTGTCKAGMRVCGQGFWGACLGQVLPESEQCNREDDDCDGEVDEDVELGTCSTGQWGVCDVGMLRCETGITICARAMDPGPEQCNGDDDDCDGESDEEISAVCYPAAPDGCQDDGQGGFVCMGVCHAGAASCIDGEPQPCDDVLEPIAEVCGSSGAAQDDDCDGMVDDGCTCGAGDSQPCYMGPDGTLDVGECKAGTQSCDTSSNTFGECEDDVLPGVEDCSNEGHDDDCNGTDDDIRGRGDPCTLDDLEGVCRDGVHACVTGGTLECQGPAPSDEICNSLDDDCDGNTDEGLLDDVDNCGECGRSCTNMGGGTDNALSCCGASCVNTDDDEMNCGRCDNPCGQGLECCAGHCVDLQSDPLNCNSCGRMCPLNGCCDKGDCASIAMVCF